MMNSRKGKVEGKTVVGREKDLEDTATDRQFMRMLHKRKPHLCNSMWGQDRLRAGHQEVGKCSTRGGSWGMYIAFTSAMRIRQATLVLKPRGDVTRNPKQGCQCPPPQKKKDMCPQKKERIYLHDNDNSDKKLDCSKVKINSHISIVKLSPYLRNFNCRKCVI